MDDQPIRVHQGRHGVAVEERRQFRELLGEIVLPDQRARFGIPGGEDATDAERVEPIPGYDGRRFRPLAMGHGVGAHFERGGVPLRPDLLAVGEPDGTDDFVFSLPAEQENPGPADNR